MNFVKTKQFKSLFFFLAVLFFSFSIQTSSAKEYYYQNFEVDIKINKDSSFDVTEKQTYYLDGSFGFFNRDVATKGTDAITDIEVFNENNNKIPKSELDIKSISGAKHIQWNFARRDFNQEEKSWTVKYKVHGGISFLKNYDEIYWNAIPSVRDVAIRNVKVTVSLFSGGGFRSDLIRLYAEDIPGPIAGSQLDCEPECANNYKGTLRSSLPLVQQGSERSSEPAEYNSEPAENTAYNSLTSIGGYYFNEDNTEAVFWGKNIKPNTNFTVAVGFPKGIVDQSAYFKDFLFMYYGYILSILIFIGAVIYGFYHWHKTEKSREGKRAIIPQYEPPQNLRPAMAEVIVKEKLTSRGFSATIIDLAVREYVRIEEEEKNKLENIAQNLPSVIAPLIMIIAPLFIVYFSLTLLLTSYDSFFFILFLLGFPLLLVVFSVVLSQILLPKNKYYDYKIIKIKSYEKESGFEDYEKKYLDTLFSGGEYFSTKELRKDREKARVLYKEILKIKDKIYEEAELDTKAFEVGLTIEKRKTKLWQTFFFPFYIIYMIIGINFGMSQLLFLITTGIVSIGGLYAFIKYEARLSDEGIKLREDWLGFKMYLETAEKYRMQNLKPEYFEKYLPYAMIFGIEKKWAKAFEMMNIPQPAWYGGAVIAGSGNGVSAPSFSPSVFSASFASSFSSAFSSSGASGASGGGGGAGGGGGGGGGGAG